MVSWDEDGFDDLAGVHFFEGFVPIFQRPVAADDGPDIEFAAGEQAENAFPDRPVVGETSLEGDVFLDEWIQRKIEWVAAPTDFRDPTGRANEFDRSLQIIRGEIRRLDRLVGSFLTFAGNEHRERRMVDVEELVRETANLVRKEAEWRNIEIGLEIDSPVSEVLLDPEAIRSAILNLVLNSFEAMPRGGKLAIALESRDEELVLEVSDTGEGIPPADQERVFDFGHTTRDGGNGLGLATVHHCIVAEHGGRVALDSRPGEGTRVRLTLPLRREES